MSIYCGCEACVPWWGSSSSTLISGKKTKRKKKTSPPHNIFLCLLHVHGVKRWPQILTVVRVLSFIQWIEPLSYCSSSLWEEMRLRHGPDPFLCGHSRFFSWYSPFHKFLTESCSRLWSLFSLLNPMFHLVKKSIYNQKNWSSFCKIYCSSNATFGAQTVQYPVTLTRMQGQTKMMIMVPSGLKIHYTISIICSCMRTAVCEQTQQYTNNNLLAQASWTSGSSALICLGGQPAGIVLNGELFSTGVFQLLHTDSLLPSFKIHPVFRNSKRNHWPCRFRSATGRVWNCIVLVIQSNR